MDLLLGALTLGLITSLLALGVYISFRLFEVADITADGSITLGAAVAAVLLMHGGNPVVATVAGALAGALAGVVTGFLQTKCRINPLLSGILVMTALYSVNLRVMGQSNLSLMDQKTQQFRGLAAWAESFGKSFGGPVHFIIWDIKPGDLVLLGGMLLLVAFVSFALYLFFRTNFGTAMRASGDNPQMVRALGVSVDRCRILGLALSNGLVGLSGALLCQYQTYADAQMGIGSIVTGLASVIIGEALTGTRSMGIAICGTVLGSILFRQLVALAMLNDIRASDLKLITAVCLFLALVLPQVLGKLRKSRVRVTN